MSIVWNKEHPEKLRVAVRCYRVAHPDRVKEMSKKHRENRQEKGRLECRIYYGKNREKELERHRRYRIANRDKLRRASNQRYAKNVNHRIRTILAARIHDVLNGLQKVDKTMHLIGCSMEQLKARLASQFKTGMAWDNYGYRGWHVDHIRPCASFDLRDPEQQRLCFHYTNLQPLWAEENQQKGAKLKTDESSAHPLRWGFEDK